MIEPTPAWDAHRLSYAAFMFLAAVVFLVVRWLQPRGPAGNLPWRQRFVLLAAAYVGGVLGAKAPFALAGGQWAATATWLADGKTVTTAIVGAYASVELAKLILGVTAKTGDAWALPLAAALAVGRWGCFFNGCCCGVATRMPWGVDFFGDGPRHPVQIYESLFHASMAGVLLFMIGRDWLRLQRLKFYLIGYFTFRFFTELIRPAEAILGGLTFYQLVSLAMILLLLVQWFVDDRRKSAYLGSALANSP